MLLGKLIEGLNVRLAHPSAAGVRICDITEDSRTVLPSSLYIARKGEAADGNDFIPAAIAAGAVAVLTDRPISSLPADPRHSVALLTSPDVPLATAHIAERFFGDPSSKLLVFGVTGTNGKTTTTYLIHQMLNAAHVRAGLVGTVFVDDGTEVAPATMTTPPALELSRTLARMLEAGCEAAVLEVSSHSLAQSRVAAINFDAGVFTNLTGDHLDYHKTMDAYGAAKALLFSSLPLSGAGVVNADDPASERIATDSPAPIFGVSLGASPMPGWKEIRVAVRATTRWGIEAAAAGPWGPEEIPLNLPFVGRHNLMNAVQAAAVVWAMGQRGSGKVDLSDRDLSMTSLASTLRQATLPPGRLQCLTSPESPITVYVDYAHTDDALRTVLGVFREVLPRNGAGRLTVVFGCGGDRDRTKRPRMGAAAAELADRIYVTSDNPRTEEPRSIIDAIVAGMPREVWGRTTIEPDREQAIRGAISEAHAGDVVIIAGKGHEDYQILAAPGGTGPATVKRFFDDRIVARDALRARGIETPEPQPPIVIRGTAPSSSSPASPLTQSLTGISKPRTERT